MPVDAIKVDRSFVDGLGAEDEDTAIVNAIVDIANSLGLGAIAEGVETRAQLDALRDLGCDGAQGYLFAAPMCAGGLRGAPRRRPRGDAARSRRRPAPETMAPCRRRRRPPRS